MSCIIPVPSNLVSDLSLQIKSKPSVRSRPIIKSMISDDEKKMDDEEVKLSQQHHTSKKSVRNRPIIKSMISDDEEKIDDIIVDQLRQNRTMFKLLTKPPQFTKGKTEDTICEITQRYLLNANNDDHHLIDIIVTNKSLPETEQWKVRTNKAFKNFENITIDILSSKSDDYNTIGSYIQNILNCEKKEELPNILIICYHSKRVCEDLTTMFNIFGGKNYIQLNNKIKFHISFDEPDANLGVTKKFIKKNKEFIDKQLIIGILFITATPIDKFWKMLNDSGIKTLLNMNRNNTQDFNEELQNYRAFKEHTIIDHNNETMNPLYYIIDVFSNKLIDENERKILFTPGHLYTDTDGVGSHMEIVSYFNDKNYCVFLMNGKFKGFIYPNKTKIELTQFNIDNNINGELRESLVKWNELNPKTNLAITGYWVIERGITFNTIGFNFTDMILSNYHLSSINKLIQLAGRGSGGKIYVNKMNVICTTKIKDTIINFNKKIEDICSLNPKEFNRTDFIDTQNTIPVKMIINDVELLNIIIDIRNKSRKGYKHQLHNLLVEGIQQKKILVFDRNNIKKFDISLRNINHVRMYKLGDKIDVRRFKNFNDAYENYKCVSQSGDENQYNIDLAKDEFKDDEFTNPINTFWITYKY
jgi:hypothetical protein